jgi:hypothetical protein
MPLPAINDLIVGGPMVASEITVAATPPVANTSAAKLNARNGYAKYSGNTLFLTATGGDNYWYIPQANRGEANFCVVPCDKAGEAYVISDNFGGCEYHEAYNSKFNLLAFFHVHRGDGRTADYRLEDGWEQRSVIRSSVISRTLGSNWSISCIDRSVTPPKVQSKFIRVKGYPKLFVESEDSGLDPYPETRTSGCCFITTAVCHTLGMPDDCNELMALRWFRDNVMEQTSAGRKEVAEYYKTAPKILRAIHELPDPDAVFRRLYLTSIQPAVLAIHRGDMQAASDLYRDMVAVLNRRFEARIAEFQAEELSKVGIR